MSQAQLPQQPPRSGTARALDLPPPVHGSARAPVATPSSRRSPGRASTPDVLRRLRAVTLTFLLVTTALGALSAAASNAATEAVRDNTGPVLVATQNLRSSLAEADAAATAAFLSAPDEDPRQRRSYLDALGRANDQIEDVAALIGDDPAAHAALKDLASDVTRYASLVEAARATRLVGSEDAQSYLVDAVELLDGPIATSSQTLIDTTRSRLDEDIARQAGLWVFATIVGLAALGALAVLQLAHFRRTRRILSPGLAGATLLTLVGVVWLASATTAAVSTAEQAAADGFDAIVTTSEVQSAVFESKSAATEAIITGRRSERDRAFAALDTLFSGRIDVSTVEAAQDGVALGTGLLADVVATADSPRERAAAAELLARYDRYRSVLRDLLVADEEEAASLLSGSVATEFNSVNFTLEGVLGANRDQFLLGLADADRRLAGLVWAALLLPLVAAAAAWAGVQARLNDYR